MVVACLNCRKDKKKCDGVAPKCTRCNSKEWNCSYPEVARLPRVKVSDIKKKIQHLENLIQVLGLDKGDVNQINQKILTYEGQTNPSFKQTYYSHFKFNMEPKVFDKFMGSNPPSPILCKSLRLPYLNRLVDIYVEYCHPSLPFISLDKIRNFQQTEDLDNPLINAILCKSHRVLIHSKEKDTISRSLLDDPFYNRAVYLLNKQATYDNLELLQTELLIGLEEFGQKLSDLSFQRVSKVMTRAHLLGMHGMVYNDPFSAQICRETQYEKLITWMVCLFYDKVVCMFTKKPSVSSPEFIEDCYLNEIKRLDAELFTCDSDFSDSDFISNKRKNSSDTSVTISPPALSSDKFSDTSNEFPSSLQSLRKNSKPSFLFYLIQLPKLTNLMFKLYLSRSSILNNNYTEAKLNETKELFLDVIESTLYIVPPHITIYYANHTTNKSDPSYILGLQLFLMVEVLKLEAYSGLIKIASIQSEKYPNSLLYDPINEIENVFKPKLIESGIKIMKSYNHTIPNYLEKYAISSILIAIPLLMAIITIDREKLSDMEHAGFIQGKERLMSYLVAWPIFSYKLSSAQVTVC